MKRHLLPAVLLLCIASACEEQAGIGTETRTPVAFALEVPAATRAGGELTTTNLTSMGVFASYTGQSNWNAATDIPNFMYNQRVTRTGSSAPWTYTPVKYWPNTAGDKLSFFAYAPHTSDTPGLGLGTAATAAGNPLLEYELQEAAEDQTDLLAAPALKNNTKSASSRAFAMKHMMTRILVQVKCEEAIRVTHINIGNVPGFADLTWDSSGNPVWEKIYLESPMGCFHSAATDVPANTDTRVAEFFMFPATTESFIDVTFNLNGTTEYKGVDIPASPAWEMGKTIAYTLNIEVGSEVTLTVKAWDTNSANNGTMGEEVTMPDPFKPFAKNGIIYESPTKSYLVSPVYLYNVLGDDPPWGQQDGRNDGVYKWDPAIRICRAMHSFGSFGKGEWRLPTIGELDKIVEFHLNSSSLWSCTDAGDGKAYHYQGNGRGTAAYTVGHRLLCIRDMGDMTYPTVRTNSDGFPIIYLSDTQRIMKQEEWSGTGFITFDAAKTYCSELRAGGYSDWRLPTENELTWMLNFGYVQSTFMSSSGRAIVGGYKALERWNAASSTATGRVACVRDY